MLRSCKLPQNPTSLLPQTQNIILPSSKPTNNIQNAPCSTNMVNNFEQATTVPTQAKQPNQQINKHYQLIYTTYFSKQCQQLFT